MCVCVCVCVYVYVYVCVCACMCVCVHRLPALLFINHIHDIIIYVHIIICNIYLWLLCTCGKYFRVSTLSIIDPGDSDIIRSVPTDTCLCDMSAGVNYESSQLSTLYVTHHVMKCTSRQERC